jgi:hypothetical protein
MTKKFVKGDKVRLKNRDSTISLSPDKTYTVSAVRDLSQPDKYFIDPELWDDPEFSWARWKTRLQVAGHPQLIFLKGVLYPKKDMPSTSKDPEARRHGFSGAWFRKVAA